MATVIKRDATPNRRNRRAGGKATRGRFLFRKGAVMHETIERHDAHVDAVLAKPSRGGLFARCRRCKEMKPVDTFGRCAGCTR